MKLQYLAPLAFSLACAPQELDPLYPEKPPVSCPTELDKRISCFKKAIAQTGALSDAQSFCEGQPLMLCQLDVMQKYENDFRIQEDPLSACTSSVADSGKRTVELQCLLRNFTSMSQVQSDIRSELQACDENVLLCYERLYSQLP